MILRLFIVFELILIILFEYILKYNLIKSKLKITKYFHLFQYQIFNFYNKN